MAIKGLVIANMRTASTFLVRALDSHPDMWWHPAEPLLHAQITGADYIETLMELHASDMETSVVGCKVTYAHAITDQRVLRYCGGAALRVVHLVRDNTLRWAISVAVLKAHKGLRPGHTTEDLPMARVYIEPNELADEIAACEMHQSNVQSILEGGFSRLLRISYEELTGGGPSVPGPLQEANDKLCNFFDVENYQMTSPMRGVNRYPMQDIVINWDELVETIGAKPEDQF